MRQEQPDKVLLLARSQAQEAVKAQEFREPLPVEPVDLAVALSTLKTAERLAQADKALQVEKKRSLMVTPEAVAVEPERLELMPRLHRLQVLEVLEYRLR
jgi:hypothetical protein